MARGASRAGSEFNELSYQKSNLQYYEESLVSAEDDINASKYRNPERKESALRVMRGLMSGQDPEPIRQLTDFFSAVFAYQGDKHFTDNKDHKSRRQDLAQAFEKLPDNIKQQFKVSPDIMEVLVRGGDNVNGVKKYASPGPDGKVNASFTTDRSWAMLFAKHSTARPKPEGAKPEIFTKRDVESFKDVIDLRRVGEFRRSFRELASINLKLAVEEAKKDRSKDKQVAFLGEALMALDASGGDWYGASTQDEYFVTDINWRKA